jgi:hypothetical protein
MRFDSAVRKREAIPILLILILILILILNSVV